MAADGDDKKDSGKKMLSTEAMHHWRHKQDGRVRRTRPGTAADKRYEQFSDWEKI